jgi:hypothetical protein
VYRFTNMAGCRASATLGTAARRAASLGILLLAGCPTVDLGDTPTEIGLCNPTGGLAYFQDQIWPAYVVRSNPAMACSNVGCHVAGGNGLDFPAQVDYAVSYRRTQIYLNCGNPEASQFLTKPLAGVDPHGGGDLFANANDPAVQIFLNWFK